MNRIRHYFQRFEIDGTARIAPRRVTGKRTAVHLLRFPLTVLAGLALLALPRLTWAQTSAAIVGTVTDRTGSVVAGARVTAVHRATNNTYTASTNDRGDYRVDLRQLGHYNVRVEMASFKATVFNNVLIEVGQTARLDATLAVGEVAESITVEDASPLVRTETASIGEVVDSRKILELPLKGREFIQLATLMPGVASRNPNGVGQTQGTTIEVNGQRGNSNNYRLNGLSNVSSTDNTQSSAPPLDAVQEFQIIRNMYSVEFGRAQGAVIDVRTKSGTNVLHGSAYEFLRNSALDARQYFALTKPGFTYNQYGGSIGGPVVLPKLLNGRDKTFFFFAFEGLKDRRGTTLLWGVPTAAEKRGDFSQSLQPAPRPWRAGTVTGGPYPGGIIPSTSFSPTGKIIMDQFPEPNYPAGGLLNFIASNPQPINAYRYIVRVDQKIKSDSLFLTISPTRQNAAQKHPLFSHSDSTSYQDGGQYVLGYTHAFSPKVLSETRFGTAYSYGGRDLVDKTNYAQKWGFPFFPTNPAAFGVPRIQVQLGSVVLGEVMGHGDAPSVSKDDSYNLVQQFIGVHKNHYFKAGVDINYERFRTIAGYGSRGVYRGGLNYSGNSWADILLGLSSRSWYQPQTAWVRLDRPLYAFYFQDDWKIHPRVTLNLGVRYDYNEAWRARDKLIAGFDLRTGQVVYAAGAVPEAQKAQLQYPARFDGPDRAYNAYKKDWAPRLGLAWRPFGGNKTVVRSGYGIFYTSPRGGEITSAARLAPWLSYLRFSEGNATTPLFFDRVPPGINEGVFSDPGTLFPNDPNRRDSYTQHWNFGVEREVLRGLAIETSYVGNRAAHLSVGRDANFFAPQYIGKPRYLPFSTIQWASNGFDAIYHALQVKATQRFSHGLFLPARLYLGKGAEQCGEFLGLCQLRVPGGRAKRMGQGTAGRAAPAHRCRYLRDSDRPGQDLSEQPAWCCGKYPGWLEAELYLRGQYGLPVQHIRHLHNAAQYQTRTEGEPAALGAHPRPLVRPFGVRVGDRRPELQSVGLPGVPRESGPERNGWSRLPARRYRHFQALRNSGRSQPGIPHGDVQRHQSREPLHAHIGVRPDSNH